jgi:uncharacterized membrane protein
VREKVGRSKRRSNGKADDRNALTAAAKVIRDIAANTRAATDEIIAALPASLSNERRALLAHAQAVVGDMFALKAELLDPDLSPEKIAALRDWIQHAYLRRFDIDPTSERHARAALLGLIHASLTSGEFAREILRVKEAQAQGPIDVAEHVATLLDLCTQWVLDRYSADFPSFAAKLATEEKRALLKGTIAAWAWANILGGHPKPGQWQALEVLSNGVFKTGSARDWQINVWGSLKDLVCGDGSDERSH